MIFVTKPTSQGWSKSLTTIAEAMRVFLKVTRVSVIAKKSRDSGAVFAAVH